MDDVSYTVYRPKKLDIGIPHPDPVVENTSMAAVDPPELWYNLKLQVRACFMRARSCLPYNLSLGGSLSLFLGPLCVCFSDRMGGGEREAHNYYYLTIPGIDSGSVFFYGVISGVVDVFVEGCLC